MLPLLLRKKFQLNNISHQTPLMRRVTRSMVKKKCQTEQREMAVIFIEDSSPERKVDSPLDLCWNEETEEAYDIYSPLCRSPIQDPFKISMKDPITPPYEPSEEKVSSPTGAEIYEEDSKLQKKLSKLRRVIKENKVLIRVMKEENNRYKEHNVR